MTLDHIAQKTAAKLLGEFGANVVLSHVSVGDYDPATGALATTVVAETVKSAPPRPVRGEEIAEGLCRSGDMAFTIAAAGLGAAPETNDTIAFGGKIYTVVGVKAVYGGALAAVYDCYGRWS